MQSLNKTLQELMRGQNIANNIQQTMKQVYADKDVQAFLNENRDRLSKEAIKRGRSKLYEFFHEKQLIEKGVPTVAPGYSPQLVISAGQIDVTYVPTKQLLERQQQRYIQRLVNSINMPKFIKNASYDDYYLNEDTQTDTRTKAIQAAMDFNQDFTYMENSESEKHTSLEQSLMNSLRVRKFQQRWFISLVLLLKCGIQLSKIILAKNWMLLNGRRF